MVNDTIGGLKSNGELDRIKKYASQQYKEAFDLTAKRYSELNKATPRNKSFCDNLLDEVKAAVVATAGD